MPLYQDRRQADENKGKQVRESRKKQKISSYMSFYESCHQVFRLTFEMGLLRSTPQN